MYALGNPNLFERRSRKSIFSNLFKSKRQRCGDKLAASHKGFVLYLFQRIRKDHLPQIAAALKCALSDPLYSLGHHRLLHLAFRKGGRHDLFYGQSAISVGENNGFLVLPRKTGNAVAIVNFGIAKQIAVVLSAARRILFFDGGRCTGSCLTDCNVAVLIERMLPIANAPDRNRPIGV